MPHEDLDETIAVSTWLTGLEDCVRDLMSYGYSVTGIKTKEGAFKDYESYGDWHWVVELEKNV